MIRRSFFRRDLVWQMMLTLTIAALLGSPSVVHAQSEESEEARQATEKARRRRYPGGKDEQELTVQAALPTTSRYPQDPKVANGLAKDPNSDEGHD